MKIISIYPNFKNKGGAQNITIQLAKELNGNTPIILTNTPIEKIHQDYKKEDIHFEKFSIYTIFKYNTPNTVFLSHHRSQTSRLVFLNFLLAGKLKVIHIAHSTFTNLKSLTWLPEKIVAISNGVKQNLIDYFQIKNDRITVIFNGIEDIFQNTHYTQNTNEIRILLAGRICPVKQQIELVKQTKGKLLPHIKFYFAGTGEQIALLKQEIGNSEQYFVLGQIDISEEMPKYDYVCLFSQNEGLGLTLIEGCMFGKPLISNDLASVQDVNINGYNGFVASTWEKLITCLNSLPLPNSEKYQSLSKHSRALYEKRFRAFTMINEYRTIIKSFFKNKYER